MPVTLVGEKKAAVLGAVNSITITPTVGGSQGNVLVLAMVLNDSSVDISSITDTAGNHWFWINDSASTATALAVACCYQNVAVTTASSITVTFTATTFDGAYWLEEFTGWTVDFTRIDQHQVAPWAATTVADTQATSRASYYSTYLEIAVFRWSVASGTFTDTAGYAKFTTGNQGVPAAVWTGVSTWKLATVSGTSRSTGTVASSSGSAIVVQVAMPDPTPVIIPQYTSFPPRIAA